MLSRGLTAALCVFAMSSLAEGQTSGPSLERGRYIATIGGCNDCHTENYAMSEGKVPDSEWLKGSVLGWRGPWGTTYPANLRLRLAEMSEDEWVEFARTFKTRPPMPWYDVNIMDEADLRSLYMFITSFEEKGDPAPDYVSPDEEPPPPYVSFPEPPKQ
jgi:hypothetical protein